MAGSRIEKLSTIFKRYTGLIKSGALLEENRPLWYDIYKHFPPSIEPLAIREEPRIDVKSIYYPEDILRARFNRVYGNNVVTYDFVSKNRDLKMMDSCDLFISKYLQLSQTKSNENGIDLNDSGLFDETEKALNDEHGLKLKRISDN